MTHQQRFRRWLRDEGLMLGIVLILIVPLMLLAVANTGVGRGRDNGDWISNPDNIQR